jgi:two-component system, OmpR family, heavy metal sensor histidine kinase CusS
MSWRFVDPRGVRGRSRWAITTWLTLFYTLSVFVLLAAASAVLYWGLQRDMRQEDKDFLAHKMQVLAVLLEKRPLDRSGIDQEVLEEAEISGRSTSPFFLRVLDDGNALVGETPGMAVILPASVFPLADSSAPREDQWESAGRLKFLLAAQVISGSRPARGGWRIQAALNVTSQETLLAGYRRDIGVVLVGGLLVAALLGTWITRRGLRPIADITRATERVGVQQLQDRIQTRPWPQELASLASAFDRMLDRLQEAFERLSQFSADLAHELRTPINNLMGEAQVTLSRTRTAAEYGRVLQSALEEYSRLARMIDSMLFLAQADRAQSALTLTPLDARIELQAVADFYQALADEEGVELICEGRAMIVADSVLLRRALSNLLSNALKYTARGGRIILRAETTDGAATLSVIDSGIGIASEHLPRLGDRFYRVDPSRTSAPAGAGLGLSIVKSVIALHGGRLLIESVPGQGTAAMWIFATEQGQRETAL